MKTKYLKRILTVCFTATALLFSSCLKDTTREFNPETVPILAELPFGGLVSTNFKNSTVVANPTTGKVTVTFAVGVTGADLPTSPHTITIAIDNATIAAYNLSTSKSYIAVPDGAATLASTKITIPAGQQSVLTTMVVDGTQLNTTSSYMIPVKITDAGGIPISANFGINYFHIR